MFTDYLFLVTLTFSTSLSVVRSGHRNQRLLFNIVSGLRSATLFKKGALAQVLSCKFYEISKNTFSYRTPPDDCFHVVWFWFRFFVSILCWKPSTDVAETSILGNVGVLDPHLVIVWCHDLSKSLLSGLSSNKVFEASVMEFIVTMVGS